MRLAGTLYLPADRTTSAPAIVTLTPYIAQTYHERGVYFAAHGYPFLAVDVRGRGNSEGDFRPFHQEAQDGHDVVEWLAQQSYCNGRVAMWGGSYMGYVQWVTAKERPPHLATIVPAASPYMGVDFPSRNNVFYPYLMQWLILVGGRTAQDRIFNGNEQFWRGRLRDFLESGARFDTLDQFLGYPSPIFHEWLAHPHEDTYWDGYNPTADDYAHIRIPILTITGIYDADQPGALAHYRRHLQHAPLDTGAQHCLVIGPWDHVGTRAPQQKFAGIDVGPASIIDVGELQLQWYAWALATGPRPPFLRKNVAYYVLGREEWRYTDSLEAITHAYRTLHLDSAGSASSVFASGWLAEACGHGPPDSYLYDPHDTRLPALEAASGEPFALRPTFPTDNLRDQSRLFAAEGSQLVYHSVPFDADQEVSGFFTLTAWIAIDRSDADFQVCVYEIDEAGGSLLLSSDCLRARYRESLRESALVDTTEPLLYRFEHFTFVSRLVRKRSRLRLVFGPVNSIYFERNCNNGGTVSAATIDEARAVTVTLFHDEAHQSALHVPMGQH